MASHEIIVARATGVLLPALRAYAYSLTRNPWDADDLVQETLLKALANVSRFELGSSLKAWLFTIMLNSFRNTLKRRSRETLRDAAGIALEVAITGGQEAGVLLMETAQALDKMSPEHQEVILLVGALGLSHEDAAVVAGCPVGTIKSRLTRARQQLADLLRQE
jgi:RNA polymerase sigma-70 factor (ECF subfamily)